ncbi:MAG: type I-B CRISPR-associated protein Cas7/Cst2/DevR [Bacteroidia bacterium]|nr:type I-B CRISPR-associated protein Cas7/Cst2/DevR [Bacteroidia bacterium]
MAFLSGIQVIYAPASALNNAGIDSGDMAENKVTVKKLREGNRVYPYVSAQAWRYWLRQTLAERNDWKPSPIFREEKIAYTEANPIDYDDDDVFGYMRAPSSRGSEKANTLTRVSPLRMGTLVSLTSSIVTDYGTMSRHEGNPVPHEHEFYTGPLRGLFGLDLGRVGVFTVVSRTGFQNLDDVRAEQAKKVGAEIVGGGRAYVLPDEVRWKRIKAVLEAFPVVEGGAKQTLHASDVTPVIVVMAVFQGGVNPFWHVIHADPQGNATIAVPALEELYRVWQDYMLSPLYIGWTEGYPRDAKEDASSIRNALLTKISRVVWDHPRKVFQKLIEDLEAHPDWWKAEESLQK